VYFNERDADEYTGYIQQLQDQGILLQDLEHLELEELQGVSGLKALRVGVVLEYNQAVKVKTREKSLKKAAAEGS